MSRRAEEFMVGDERSHTESRNKAREFAYFVPYHKMEFRMLSPFSGRSSVNGWAWWSRNEKVRKKHPPVRFGKFNPHSELNVIESIERYWPRMANPATRADGKSPSHTAPNREESWRWKLFPWCRQQSLACVFFLFFLLKSAAPIMPLNKIPNWWLRWKAHEHKLHKKRKPTMGRSIGS